MEKESNGYDRKVYFLNEFYIYSFIFIVLLKYYNSIYISM